MERILVADDELSMREFLEILLQKEGYAVETVKNGEEAIERIKNSEYDLIVCDVMMPKGNGMEVLKSSKKVNPLTPVIMITAFASTESAVEAMKMGAYDYITKPFQVDEIKLIVSKALEKVYLVRDNIRLQKEVEHKYMFDNIVGASPPMKEMFDLIRKIAPTRSNVLLLGESGTGKELVAKAVHYNSPRRDKPFVTVNCGAIPSELLESELFGHKKGSFTGAYNDKRGLFEVAHKGTIFLDEIGDTPLSIQVKLLRAIQEKAFKPIGGVEDVNVDARVIAASNRDMEKAIRTGEFREDLYYRLNVIMLRMPPLRDRQEDIPMLVRHFIKRFAAEIGKKVIDISPEAERLLVEYKWPGNVRELENAIERAVSLTTAETIAAENLPERIKTGGGFCGDFAGLEFPEEGVDLDLLLAGMEREYIEEALRRSRNVKNKAAKLLGLSFRSLRYRMEKLGIAQEEETEDYGEDDF